MRREIKDLWVKALRSGEFKQIKGKLSDDRGYCALGVLAVLALVEGKCTYDKGGKYDGRRLQLSYSIMEWAGIAQLDDAFLEAGAGAVNLTLDGEECSISQLNDSGKTFGQIADIIEMNWREM